MPETATIIKTADSGVAVHFTGSSTSHAAIERWVASGIYQAPRVGTRDLRMLDVVAPSGKRIQGEPGDWVVRNEDGTFTVQTQLPLPM